MSDPQVNLTILAWVLIIIIIMSPSFKEANLQSFPAIMCHKKEEASQHSKQFDVNQISFQIKLVIFETSNPNKFNHNTHSFRAPPVKAMAKECRLGSKHCV